MNKDVEILTVKEFADYLRVHGQTIKRWIKAKKIKAFQIRAHGSWRIKKSELEKIIK